MVHLRETLLTASFVSPFQLKRSYGVSWLHETQEATAGGESNAAVAATGSGLRERTASFSESRSIRLF